MNFLGYIAAFLVGVSGVALTVISFFMIFEGNLFLKGAVLGVFGIVASLTSGAMFKEARRG